MQAVIELAEKYNDLVKKDNKELTYFAMWYEYKEFVKINYPSSIETVLKDMQGIEQKYFKNKEE